MIDFAATGRRAGGPRDADSATADPVRPVEGPTEELDRLGDEIAELAAHIHAATYRLLVLLAEFDRRRGWYNGFRSCAHWFSWRTRVGMGAAREHVRVARALVELPGISERMSRGELSYSVARALTRVATPENEEELMTFALHGTAAQVERLVRAWRRVDRNEEAAEEARRHEARRLTLHPDEDGSWVVRGRLDPEAGAVLQRALEAAQVALYDGESDVATHTSAGQRRADALGLLAEWALRAGLGGARASEGSTDAEEGGEELPAVSGVRAERFQVVVHVDAGALAEGSETGQAVLASSGVRVPAETARRIACDAGRVVMTHGPDGSVLDVGRKTRTLPPALRRALEYRDRRCRFPGCGLRITEGHHLRHWADEGETKLSNLVLLCPRHHRAVHEGGLRVEVDEEGALRFHRPDGRPIPEAPEAPVLPERPVEALRGEHRRRGITPGPWTSTPDWHGEPLDLGHAIDTLWRPRPRPEEEAAGGEGKAAAQGEARAQGEAGGQGKAGAQGEEMSR